MHLGVAGGGRPRERAGAGPVGPGWFRPQAGQRPHLLLGPDPAGPDGPQWHPVRGAGPAAQVHLAVHRHRQAQPEQAQGPGGVRGQPPEPLRRPGLPGRARRPRAAAAGRGRRGRLLLQFGGEGRGRLAGPRHGAVRALRRLQPRLPAVPQGAGRQGMVGADLPIGHPRHRRVRVQEGLRLPGHRRPGPGRPSVPARPRPGDAQGLVHPPSRRGGRRHRPAHPPRRRLQRAGHQGRGRRGRGAHRGQGLGGGVGRPVPRNPFANPLFLPVFLRVMALIVIGPLFVIAVFVGGFVAFLLATFVVVQGCSEFARIAGIDRRYAYLLILGGELGLLVAALARDFFGFLPFGFFIALTLLPILSGQITDAHRQVADTLVGYVFVALPMAYIVLVKSAEPWGLNFLVIVTVSVALSDIAAYAASSALRGRKLMPRVDPTKTWGGVLGNLVGAAVGVGWLWVAVPPDWSMAAVVVLVLVIAAGSVWADLTGSFIQRAFQTEARSTVLLGYGGVLSRVDSLLITFPLSYYALILVDKVVR